jgi:hypothetical protein
MAHQLWQGTLRGRNAVIPLLFARNRRALYHFAGRGNRGNLDSIRGRLIACEILRRRDKVTSK